MCGRYSLFPNESQEIKALIEALQDQIKVGEVFPTNSVPVLLEGGNRASPAAMVWGYPRFQGKSGAIINARSETALERPMFRKSVLERRCIFPTTGFYEWGTVGNKKQKYRFNLPGPEKALYLAGLWNDYSGQARCVILTTTANGSVRRVHDRMPLVLEKSQLNDWLLNTDRALQLLTGTPPELTYAAPEPALSGTIPDVL